MINNHDNNKRENNNTHTTAMTMIGKIDRLHACSERSLPGDRMPETRGWDVHRRNFQSLPLQHHPLLHTALAQVILSHEPILAHRDEEGPSFDRGSEL